MANVPMKSVILPGLPDKYTFAQIDNTLTQTGDAADAKKVGDEFTQLKADFTQLDGKIAATQITNTASGAIASFPDGADGVPVKDLAVQITPVQSGTGDPSPENIRPISGWTGCNIFRGKNNLWDTTPYKSIGYNTDIGTAVNLEVATAETNINGDTITYSAGAWGGRSFRTPILKSGTYHVRYDVSNVTNARTSIYTIRDGKISDKYYSTSSAVISRDVTVLDGDYIVVVVAVSSAGNVTINGYQIVAGTTGIVWEPYQGNTYSITFPTEAGTVYGGTLDVTTGVLTIDKFLYVYDGTESFQKSGSALNGFYNNLAAGTLPHGWAFMVNYASVGALSDEKSSMFKVTLDTSTYFNNYGYVLLDSGMNFNCDPDVFGSTVASFTAKLAELYVSGTPVSVFAKLKENHTYQLTPTEVATILGQNNIWADTGDVSVDYRADTKLYIENLTAPSEDDMVANTNIPNGTYFMIGNNLFLSTTTIPAGDTINPGTNCTLMNLASALNALNS